MAGGTSEFREFFRTTVSLLCPVQTAPSGLAAFSRCLDQPPYALFLAPDLGSVSSEVLVRKLRAVPRLSGIRVIGIEPPRTLNKTRLLGFHEAVLIQSFNREVFLRGLQALLATPAAPADGPAGVPAGVPDLWRLAMSTAEASLGAAIGCQVVVRAHPDDFKQPTTASAELRVGADRVPVTLRLTVPATSVGALAARLAGTTTLQPDDPPAAALIALAIALGDDVATALRGRGLEVARVASPRVSAPSRTPHAQPGAARPRARWTSRCRARA